jgi:hypothetical protein
MNKGNVKKTNLDKYIIRPHGRPKYRYISYAEGAETYKMPYGAFIRLARLAEANLTLSKKGIVDIDILDAYIESHPDIRRKVLEEKI